MFIVITGLDGSGTSTIANALNEIDKGSTVLKTPSVEFSNRDIIDEEVRNLSQKAHYLYYLSSVVFMSDKIKKEYDYKNQNVYCVRYLIDTVVSHRVAGLDVQLDYEQYDILKPDLTIFINLNENIRQERINKRGKSILDKLLDDDIRRQNFMDNFSNFLDDQKTIYFDNSTTDLKADVKKLLEEIRRKSHE